MTATIPTWTRDFVTATTEDEAGRTITRCTNWRVVLDPSWLNRHPNTHDHDVDLTIVADDATHGPDLCDCHDEGSAYNQCCMSVPEGTEREMTDAARTALAEQGFRIDGPWIPGPGGTLTASLMPVILDPQCAAYEPESAAKLLAAVR